MLEEARRIVEEYDSSNLSIATLGSHSALQILHGARLEGFRTALIVDSGRRRLYERFNLVDEFLEVERFSDIGEKEAAEMRRLNGILIPHGSLVEYLGYEKLSGLRVPIFGSREIVRWERDWRLKLRLLEEAGIPTPRLYNSPKDVKGPAMVKLPGAKGGRGYFLVSTSEEAEKGVEKAVEWGLIENPSQAIIQEYVIGVPMYFHYFYSPIYNRVELMGMDLRYESNVDGLRRIPLERFRVEPSFVVVGNIPVMARESLLRKVFDYGDAFVETVKRLIPPGIIGPFCLEAIVTDELEVKVFEFSGRIVAGTNLYLMGSSYSQLLWDKPMSTGRRIALEIKLAAENGALDEVVT